MGSDQKRALSAVILSGLVLFVWQTYFAPTPALVTEPVHQAQVQTQNTRPNQPMQNANMALNNAGNTQVAAGTSFESFELTNKNGDSIIVNSDLSIVNINNHSNFYNFRDTVGENVFPFRIYIFGKSGLEPINFAMSASGNQLTGTNTQYDVTLNLTLSENGNTSFRLYSPVARTYRIALQTSEKQNDSSKMRRFAFFGSDIKWIDVDDEITADDTIQWMGIDFNYHFFAVDFKNKHILKYNNSIGTTVDAETKDNVALGTLSFDMVNPVNSFEGDFLFVKKNYDLLKNVGHNLDKTIDFGFWYFIAVPILRGLQFIYKYLPNYGIAIILLTLVFRIITLPLTWKSSKSQMALKKIQPELTKIKEKYKDDQQLIQKKTMELFKKSGANPLGGCLPMLLQLPLFFAFYQVLGNSVELLGAPFFGWIQNLSEKDPYYVFPVLLVIVFFIQQKLTPTPSADPNQQKIMMMMPLFFGFVMKDLPAGLSVYFFFSTLFGILQQVLINRISEA